MPSFTVALPDIQSFGPIVQVTVTPSVLYAETLQLRDKELPSPIRVHALIDTGASGTVVKKDIPEKFGLSPVGTTFIQTPSNSNVLCYQYDLQFILPNKISFNGIITAAPLKEQNIQCLLGRDILSDAVFIYIGYNNSFTLSF